MPLTPIKQAFDDSRCLRLIRDKVPFWNYEPPALTTELLAREADHCDGLEVVWKVFQFSDKEDSGNGSGGSMVTLR